MELYKFTYVYSHELEDIYVVAKDINTAREFIYTNVEDAIVILKVEIIASEGYNTLLIKDDK